MSIRARAVVWGLLAIGIALTCALQLSSKPRLQTNLLAVLPATERNETAEKAFNRLADMAGNRAVFLVGQSSLETSTIAARNFADQLRKTQTFKQVISDIPPINTTQLTQFYLQHRFRLLSDADRTALSTGKANLESRLLHKLHSPFRFGLTLSPADDPFGFTDNWLASLPLQSLKLQSQNGLLTAPAADKVWVLVTAELPGSAYDNQVQQTVFHAVEQAESLLHQHYPDAHILRTGTVFYAHAARANAEREMNLFAAITILGILLLLYWVFRSIRPLALGLLSVAFGIGAAFAATVAVYGELHLITLVFGASLIGEAIDYAIQYFAAHLDAGSTWDPLEGLRRIRPALTLALFTSLLGYAALMLAPFPVLSQIALFALVGLSAACASVYLLLPATLSRPTTRHAEDVAALPKRFLDWWQTHITPRRCYLIIAGFLFLSIPGWLQLSSNDDVRLLIARPPSLIAQEEKIRDLIGFTNSKQFYLVEGKTADDVLNKEENLRARLMPLIKQDKLTGVQSLSSFVPSQEQQQANQNLWAREVVADGKKLKGVLARAGLRDDLAKRYLTAFHQSASGKLQLDDWLATPMATPYRHLWLGQTKMGYASIVLPQGIRDLNAIDAATQQLPGVTLVDKAGSVSALFAQYRKWGALWLVGALGIVFLVLSLRYRWRGAAIVMIPTLIGMASALAALGYLHIPLTLFNVMGLMLVLGVGVNYAIFLREGGMHAAATLTGVLLSAATTLLSYGLLSFSSMPALSNFGIMLLVGIGIGVLCAPIVLSFEGKRENGQ